MAWTVFIDESGSYEREERAVIVAVAFAEQDAAAAQNAVAKMREKHPHVPWPYHGHFIERPAYHFACKNLESVRLKGCLGVARYIEAVSGTTGVNRREAVAELRESAHRDVTRLCSVQTAASEQDAAHMDETIRHEIGALKPLLFIASEAEGIDRQRPGPLRYNDQLVRLVGRVVRALAFRDGGTPTGEIVVANRVFKEKVFDQKVAKPKRSQKRVNDEFFGQDGLDRLIAPKSCPLTLTSVSYYGWRHAHMGLFAADWLAGQARRVLDGVSHESAKTLQTRLETATETVLSTPTGAESELSHLVAVGVADRIESRAVARWAVEQALGAA